MQRNVSHIAQNENQHILKLQTALFYAFLSQTAVATGHSTELLNVYSLFCDYTYLMFILHIHIYVYV